MTSDETRHDDAAMTTRDRVAAARGRVKRWLFVHGYSASDNRFRNDRLACSYETAPLFAEDIRLLVSAAGTPLFATGPNPLTVERPCKSCGRPYSPDHDASAPGPTARHPFIVDRRDIDGAPESAWPTPTNVPPAPGRRPRSESETLALERRRALRALTLADDILWRLRRGETIDIDKHVMLLREIEREGPR